MTAETKRVSHNTQWGQAGTWLCQAATVLGMIGVLTATLSAQGSGESALPYDRGAPGLYWALKQANNPIRILYVIAHPDDEDSGTLTWLSRGQGAHVTLLSLTRGESGANLITGDFFDELGALRTLEHQRATATYGVQLRYTRFADFGYSKNIEETWRNWDRQDVLREVVRVVREVRPHIIMARFSGTPRDGHGHHQASGLLAQEAFAAASDPQRFAAEGVAWQALKLYAGGWQAGEPGRLAVDAGEYDPVLGQSYAQIGREGYRWHRSQAMGAVLARPGASVTNYRLVASRRGPIPAVEISPFEGLDLAADVPEAARRALKGFSAVDPLASAPSIAEALGQGQGVIAEALNRALGLALGLEFEALVEPVNPPTGMAALFRPATTFRVAVPGQTFRVMTNFYSRLNAQVRQGTRKIEAANGWAVKTLPEGRFELTVPAGSTTEAPWRRDSIRLSRYEGSSISLPPLIAQTEYEYRGARGHLSAVPQVSFVDSIGLQHREPLAVGPALSVSFDTSAGVLPLDRAAYPTEVVVRNTGSLESQGTVSLDVPAGWRVEPASYAVSLQREGQESRFQFKVVPGGKQSGEFVLQAVVRRAGEELRRSFERVTYSGLDSIYLAHPAQHRVRRMDVRVAPNLRIGYVMGTGDEVPATIRQLGAAVDLLDAQALGSADLGNYSAIWTGIRAYAARDDLRTHNARLLKYVEQGGTLVVQYNTQEFDQNFGPYPYQMTMRAEETSEEDAPVSILAADHPVFQYPNRITPADFDGWFEQRGSKFFTSWDPRYVPLIETHDTGQAPQKGVWVAAKYGKGNYVYCALAWYRQLPMAVPGAVRLFANLISLPAASQQ